MNLTTEINFPDLGKPITAKSKILFMGSCFADEIGGKMRRLHLDVNANGLGIAYNPISIANLLNRAQERLDFKESELQWNGDYFVHPDLHGKFNSVTKETFINKANKSLNQLSEGLEEADLLVITLGTSIIFETLDSKIVNNCHKLPSHLFKKRMLDLSEMLEPLRRELAKLKAKNAKLAVILTVSPIRHLRHGSIENMRSKARLLMICEELTSKLDFCNYFPVFEFVMDELRDYRFYDQRDLIHMNEAAINMIFQKFKKHTFSKELLPFAERIDKWNLMMEHRIANQNTKSTQEFLEKIRSTGQALLNDSEGILNLNIQTSLDEFEKSLIA